MTDKSAGLENAGLASPAEHAFKESDHPLVATISIKKRCMLASVYEAPWKTDIT